MTVRPMLDDLELPQVQEVRTGDRRVLAEHRAPGMDGSLLQDLGRRSTRLEVLGVASGPEAFATVAKLEAKLKAAKPVPFAADIVADLETAEVVIDDLVVEELAGRPDRLAYTLVLREHVEPLAPESTDAIDLDVLDEAADLIGDLAGALGALDEAAAVIAGLQPFAGQFSDLLARLTAFRQGVEGARTP